MQDWARGTESFSWQESSDETTFSELDRKIAAAEVDVEQWKKLRDELRAQEAAVAAIRTAAIKNEKQVQLDALRKAQLDIEAKAAVLAAEIGGRT